jgi:hypothetical protein
VTHGKWSHSYILQKFNLVIWIQGPNFKLSAHAFTFTLAFSPSLQFVITICNSKLERKSFLDEIFLNKHVYENIQMPRQYILPLGLHKRQNGKSSFLLHTTYDMNNGPFNHLMNLER